MYYGDNVNKVVNNFVDMLITCREFDVLHIFIRIIC